MLRVLQDRPYLPGVAAPHLAHQLHRRQVLAQFGSLQLSLVPLNSFGYHIEQSFDDLRNRGLSFRLQFFFAQVLLHQRVDHFQRAVQMLEVAVEDPLLVAARVAKVARPRCQLGLEYIRNLLD